jgi:transposase
MLPTGTRVLVCTEPQDMRRSFDRLASVVRDEMGEEPQSGLYFVFVSKSMTRAKVLWWDRNGYCLLYKRLHQALFRLPADGAKVGKTLKIDATELARLLAGVEHARGVRARGLH